MIHLEVNWIDENGEAKVRRDIRPLAFINNIETKEVHIFYNQDEWHRYHVMRDKSQAPEIYTNVTSVEYWDDGK